ncbi:alpha/beta hydrolase [Actinomycetes bacterium KLBMP 9759]
MRWVAVVAAAALLTAGCAAAPAPSIVWTSCGDAELDAAGASCADITVPLDHGQPDGRTITVAISRITASDRAGRLGVLMHGTGGGPGGLGLDGPLLTRAAMGPELAARYDLVGMDPRGVGRSSPLRCGLPGEWIRSVGFDRAAFDETVEYQRDLVRRCWERHADVLPHITTADTARDMDLVRGLLGEERMSYIGVSYGTYLGLVYTSMFGDRVDKIVFDSSVDPGRYPAHTLADIGPSNERYLDAWAAWTARHHERYGLGRTAAEVRATVEGIVRGAADEPLRFGQHALDEHTVPALLSGIMTDDRRYAEQAAVVAELRRAARGERVTPSEAIAEYLLPPDEGLDNALSMNLAILCSDGPVPLDIEGFRAEVERSRATQPIYGPLMSTVHPCAFWPRPPVEGSVRTGNDHPALLVQNTGDMRTHYEGARALQRLLPRSRMVALEGAAHHGSYGVYPNSCVTATVNSYLRDGTLPAADVTCTKDR